MRGCSNPEQPHGLVAQLDGAHDAVGAQIAGLAQRHVRAHVDRRQPLAGQQHARFGGAAQLRDVFGVPGERAARKRDRLLVQGRRHHGIRLAASGTSRWRCGRTRPPPGRSGASSRPKAKSLESPKVGVTAQQRRVASVRPVEPRRHLENPRIADHDPVGQRRDLRVGQRLEHDFRADARRGRPW